MLERRTDSLGLDTVNVGRTQLSRKVWIFRKVLEISAPKRGALDVYAGPQEYVDAERGRLRAQCSTDLANEIRISGR